MMSSLATQTLPWVAAAAILLAAGAAVVALTSRSLFNVCIGLAAVCACAAAALLALGYADGALALALVGVAVAPVLLLGAMLLSSRAVKPRTRRLPWLSLGAAALAVVAMLWASLSLDLRQPIQTMDTQVPLALVAFVFAAIATCVALLGYGERGVLGTAPRGRDG